MSIISELWNRIWTASNRKKLEAEANRTLDTLKPRALELVSEATGNLVKRVEQGQSLAGQPGVLAQAVYARLEVSGWPPSVVGALKVAVTLAQPRIEVAVGETASSVRAKVEGAAARIKAQVANARVRL